MIQYEGINRLILTVTQFFTVSRPTGHDQEVNNINLSDVNYGIVMKLNGKPIDILRVVDLKEELAKRDLPRHGKKQDLVQRLTNYLQQNPHECDAEEPDTGPDMAGGGGSAPIAATAQQGQVTQ